MCSDLDRLEHELAEMLVALQLCFVFFHMFFVNMLAKKLCIVRISVNFEFANVKPLVKPFLRAFHCFIVSIKKRMIVKS